MNHPPKTLQNTPQPERAGSIVFRFLNHGPHGRKPRRPLSRTQRIQIAVPLTAATLPVILQWWFNR
ncbi:hypothetical protein GCM10010446_66930 [Streptomyces enissocaesilis]|uniref:Transposase n=1 Tax=Streptomyces enissocaesilis TaxID=332589 RepID=A0ABN3XNG3_9ACTN